MLLFSRQGCVWLIETPARLLCPCDFPGKNIGMGCTSSTRGSSQPKDRTCISSLAEGFFTTVPPGKPKMYYKNVINMYSGILCVKLLQLCPTLCDPMDCTLPGFSIHGILQARILEWVAMLSSRGSSQPRDWSSISSIPCIGRWVFYH